jgi:hypothetical protein
MRRQVIPLDRIMAAIRGSCSQPPVVIPYLQYYFREVVEQVTPFTREDLEQGCFEVKVEALSLLHAFFDCDWIRVTKDLRWTSQITGMTRLEPALPPIRAERLLEDGLFDVAIELRRRFGDEKFVYGRVGLPYGELFEDFSDIEGALVALKREPGHCKRIFEDSIPQKMEEIRAWAVVGVLGLWLGQWLRSSEIIAEVNYLEPKKFILSCGSPVTFDTPAHRLRFFIQTAKSVRDALMIRDLSQSVRKYHRSDSMASGLSRRKEPNTRPVTPGNLKRSSSTTRS